jgi:hypothetical protein
LGELLSQTAIQPSSVKVHNAVSLRLPPLQCISHCLGVEHLSQQLYKMVEGTQLAADNSTTHSSSDLPSSTSTQSDTQQPQIPAPSQDQSNQQEAGRKQKKKWEPLAMPQPMQIMQEDIMNNCFVKGGISCVMGGIAGFAFGLFSASLENAGAGVSLL